MISVCRPQPLWNRLSSHAIKGLRPFMWGVLHGSVSDYGGQNHVETHGRASHYNGRAFLHDRACV